MGFSASCLAAALLLGAVSGEMAFLTGSDPGTRRAAVLDTATGAVTPVGPGASDGAPVWAPGGARLAFSTKGEEGLEIWVTGPDGGDRRVLRLEKESLSSPRWSADGAKIACIAEGPGTGGRVVVFDAASGESAFWGGEGMRAARPVWLPSTDLMQALDPESQSETAEKLAPLKEEALRDGALLAAGIFGDKRISTELVLVTRTQTVPLLPLLVKDSARFAEWSVESDRKGRQLAYESNDGGDRELFVLGRRGITNVSNHRAADWNPVWSDDYQWLAFESFRDGRRGVYRVLVGTGNVLPVAVREGADCWAPAWAPDDEWIAFVSDEEGVPRIYAVAPEGGEAVRLTDGKEWALAPAWRPKPEKD